MHIHRSAWSAALIGYVLSAMVAWLTSGLLTWSLTILVFWFGGALATIGVSFALYVLTDEDL